MAGRGVGRSTGGASGRGPLGPTLNKRELAEADARVVGGRESHGGGVKSGAGRDLDGSVFGRPCTGAAGRGNAKGPLTEPSAYAPLGQSSVAGIGEGARDQAQYRRRRRHLRRRGYPRDTPEHVLKQHPVVLPGRLVHRRPCRLPRRAEGVPPVVLPRRSHVRGPPFPPRPTETL